MLPHSKFDCGITTSSDKTKGALLVKLGPEVWHTENFFEENIILHASSWPLVERGHHSHVRMEVSNWLNEENSGRHRVETALPVFLWGVIGWWSPGSQSLEHINVRLMETT